MQKWNSGKNVSISLSNLNEMNVKVELREGKCRN